MIQKIATAVRRVEPLFGPNDSWVETARQTAWRGAQRFLGGTHTFVRDKGTADYICTTEASVQQVVGALYSSGYQRNILSTVKYRTRDGQEEWIHSAWVYDPEDTDWQHDVFIWERDGKTDLTDETSDSVDTEQTRTVCDVYGHREPSVRHPAEHLDLSTGIHGDPNFRARGVLKNAGIDFSQVDTDTLK